MSQAESNKVEDGAAELPRDDGEPGHRSGRGAASVLPHLRRQARTQIGPTAGEQEFGGADERAG